MSSFPKSEYSESLSEEEDFSGRLLNSVVKVKLLQVFNVFIFFYTMYFALPKLIKGSQNVSSKSVSQRNKFLMGQLNNLILCTGVLCILTRKYQGTFCCYPYDVENFMFPFKYEMS